MNRNYRIAIIAAIAAVVLVSIPIYIYWVYVPSLYQSGLITAFWLSLENDTRDVTVARGETVVAPVELHHWENLDTALYVELRSDGRSMDEYPDGLFVSYDLDSSVISLSKGAVMVYSKNEAARFSPPEIKQVVSRSDAEMVVREFGNLTVSTSRDVQLGSYYFELSTGDTKIYGGGGGNSQLLTVTVVENIPEQDNGGALAGNDSKTAPDRSGISTIFTGNRTFDIIYSFSQSEGIMKSMATASAAAAITIEADVVNDTVLEMVLPRKFLEHLETVSGNHYCMGNGFVAFVGQDSIAIDQRHNNDTSQILNIPLKGGSSTVEIIGTDLLQSPTTCLHVGPEEYQFVRNLPGIEVDTWNDAVVIARDRLAQSNEEGEGATRGGPIGSVELVYVHNNGTAFTVNRYDGLLEDVRPYFNYTPKNSYFWIVTLNYLQERETPEYIFTIDAQTGEVKELLAT